MYVCRTFAQAGEDRCPGREAKGVIKKNERDISRVIFREKVCKKIYPVKSKSKHTNIHLQACKKSDRFDRS
jgi:hypothetical protein